MNWYVRECNNDWEHSFDVQIDTSDNPGWTIQIDLKETFLEGSTIESQKGEPAQNMDEWRERGSWWNAEADGVKFKASCGPTDLSSVIGVFRQWVDDQRS